MNPNNPLNKKPNKVYAPNSVYHGVKAYGRLSMSRESLLFIEVGRLTDFIEFLFEHSNHCDHITQNEAWKEFEIYEVKNSYLREHISNKRKQAKEIIE